MEDLTSIINNIKLSRDDVDINVVDGTIRIIVAGKYTYDVSISQCNGCFTSTNHIVNELCKKKIALGDIIGRIIVLSEREQKDNIRKYLMSCVSTSKSALSFISINCLKLDEDKRTIALINDFLQVWSKRNVLKCEISLIENNIYIWNVRIKLDIEDAMELKTKFGYDYIDVNIYFHDVHYPFYPPRIEILHPIFMDNLAYRIENSKIFQPTYWSPAWNIERAINRMKSIIRKFGKIDLSSEFNSIELSKTVIGCIERLIHQIGFCADNIASDPIDKDEIFKDWSCGEYNSGGGSSSDMKLKHSDSGVGYTKAGDSGWNITTYESVQVLRQEELSKVFGKIVVELEKGNRDVINYVGSSHITKFISQQLMNCTPIAITKNEYLHRSFFRILVLLTKNNIYIDKLEETLSPLCSDLQRIVEIDKSNDLINFLIDVLSKDILPFYVEHRARGKDVVMAPVKHMSQYVEVMNVFQFDMADIVNSDYYKEYTSKLKSPSEYSKVMSRIISEVAMMKGEGESWIHEDSSIFLRVDSNKVFVMRFLITGPTETPYDAGCYIFDMLIPNDYPKNPPAVIFRNNGGKRFNPNLYDSGYICLSILKTYSGPSTYKSEQWNESSSTLKQVIVSIQSQILTVDPWFNEPGRDSYRGTEEGKKRVENYNKEIIIYNMKYTILGMLENPAKYPEFEDVVNAHFRMKKDYIIKMMEKWSITAKGHEFDELQGKIISMLNNLK
jgi:ubiquitin-protein ligase